MRHHCSVKGFIGQSNGLKYYSIGDKCAIAIPEDLVKWEAPNRVVYGGGIGGEDCAYILDYSEAEEEVQ